MICIRGAAVDGDVVLEFTGVLDVSRKADYYALLKQQPLPKRAAWLEEGARAPHTVLIDTVNRFKGLEAPIVILWGLDATNIQRSHELLYVAMSRAKSLLVVAGTPVTCASIRALP